MGPENSITGRGLRKRIMGRGLGKRIALGEMRGDVALKRAMALWRKWKEDVRGSMTCQGLGSINLRSHRRRWCGGGWWEGGEASEGRLRIAKGQIKGRKREKED
jgi:hypothetical protein